MAGLLAQRALAVVRSDRDGFRSETPTCDMRDICAIPRSIRGVRY